jgi:hypothetical protein
VLTKRSPGDTPGVLMCDGARATRNLIIDKKKNTNGLLFMTNQKQTSTHLVL